MNQQGVFHLNPEELRDIKHLLHTMMKEQEGQERGMERIKTACLQIILVEFKRIKNRQYEQLQQRRDSKKDKIYEILSYMEDHFCEEIDFKQAASQAGWSVGHFRTVFKDATGVTPTEYLNRFRILKSLEYMQRDGMNVAEAAERVGILDAAYFSRLFKKVMGYSPRCFKEIER